MKSILVPVEQNDTIASTLQTARLLADAFASYVEGFALAPGVAPFLATDTVGESVLFETDLKPDAQAVRASRELFERAMAGGAGITATWLAGGARDEGFVGTYGRVFDVTVVGRPGNEAASPRASTFESAIFGSGRPVLIAPPVPPESLGSIVAIAWNRSAETARAIALAMPLLMRAGRIIVLATEKGSVVGPSGGKVVEYLERHGRDAELVAIQRDEGKSAGPALLEAASRANADLLIKGAYTQSRISQMIFGGATRHILSDATLPVFMAH